MRIGTYNVLGLRGFPPEEARKVIGDRHGEVAARHFVKVFRSLGCDLLALQEGVTVPQMQRIAGALGCHLATFASPVAWPGHLLSRYPIHESRCFTHFQPGSEPRLFSRTAGAARVDLPNGDSAWVLVIHLHPSDLGRRNEEADALRSQVLSLLGSAQHMVVLGDFNCEVNERLHHHLKELGFVNAVESSGGGLQPTVDTAGIDGTFCIDHIYVSPSLAPALAGARVVRDDRFRSDGPPGPGEWVHSDHLPVVADFAIDGEVSRGGSRT